MERSQSHRPANRSSHSPQNPTPASSSLFLYDNVFSCHPSNDPFMITPNLRQQIASPGQYFTENYDSLQTHVLTNWDEGPRPPSPLPCIDLGASGLNQIGRAEDKKKMHRETERQRRQGMNSLVASLRLLLPLESIKGKRSTLDHMNEALNYINHLKGKIKCLEAKRDKLKRKSSFVALQPESGSSSGLPSQSCSVNCFSVSPCLDGIEVVIRGDFTEQDHPLSRVLQLLANEEISIVSCISTRNNGITIYTIKSEGCDLMRFDIAGLQRKLGELLNYY